MMWMWCKASKSLTAAALVYFFGCAGDQACGDPFGDQEISEDRRIQAEAPGAFFVDWVSWPLPNVELPEQVVAREGQLTLFADFGNTSKHGVPVYLVNRTGEAVPFPTDSIYLKLEFLDKHGHWVRAQNEVGGGDLSTAPPLILGASQHFKSIGYMPKGGQKAPGRYRTYANRRIVSNVGEGRYEEADRLAASLDLLNQGSAPHPLVMLAGLPTIEDGNPDPTSPRDFVAALDIVSKYRESAFFRRAAERFAGRLPADSIEAKAIRMILARQWPREPDDLELFGYCLEIVGGAGDPPDPGFSDVQPVIAWKVIRAQLSDNRSERTDPEWQALIRKCYELLPSGIESPDKGVATEACRVLRVAALADELVPNSLLFEWLRIDHREVVEACATALSRRSKWEQLSDHASDLPPDKLPIVLAAMAFQPARPTWPRSPEGPRERAFWAHSAKSQPVETARRLCHLIDNPIHVRLSRVLHRPLREFLTNEVEWAKQNPVKAGDWNHAAGVAQVVRLVGSWRKKSDAALFQNLLDYPRNPDPNGTFSAGGPKDPDYNAVHAMAKEALKGVGAWDDAEPFRPLKEE